MAKVVGTAAVAALAVAAVVKVADVIQGDYPVRYAQRAGMPKDSRKIFSAVHVKTKTKSAADYKFCSTQAQPRRININASMSQSSRS